MARSNLSDKLENSARSSASTGRSRMERRCARRKHDGCGVEEGAHGVDGGLEVFCHLRLKGLEINFPRPVRSFPGSCRQFSNRALPSALLRREWARCDENRLEKCGFNQLEKLEPEKAYPSHVDNHCKT